MVDILYIETICGKQLLFQLYNYDFLLLFIGSLLAVVDSVVDFLFF